MAEVDLSQLAVDRRPAAFSASGRSPRRWFSRYVLPAGILLAFAGLVGWAARDSLLPAHPVRVVPVLVAHAEVQQSGTPLFQAAGWIEPRPIPTVVSSLAAGVVEELFVVEGQRIAKGEIVARLIETDAQIELRKALAELRFRKAKLDGAEAELENAQLALRNPVELQADLAEANSLLAQLDAELETLPLEIEAARARCQFAKRNLECKETAGDAIPEKLLREAKADLVSADSALKVLEGRQPVVTRRRVALQSRQEALVDRLELRLEQKTRVANARAAVELAKAEVNQAELTVDVTELQLERMTIRSPIAGRVLSVEAPPGKRVNGIDPHSERGSSAVISMYDPALLQVRVDVRLEDIPQVQLGQQVVVTTAAAPDGLVGKVSSITSSADIQKNTLQVKAAILAPPDVVRPEMLSQVTFLAPELPASDEMDSADRLKLLVPRRLVIGGDQGTTVWVADRAAGMAVKRMVTLGPAGTHDLVEVVSGLNPTEKLISSGVEDLTDGQRIRIASEDAELGSGPPLQRTPPRTAKNSDAAEVN